MRFLLNFSSEKFKVPFRLLERLVLHNKPDFINILLKYRNLSQISKNNETILTLAYKQGNETLDALLSNPDYTVDNQVLKNLILQEFKPESIKSILRQNVAINFTLEEFEVFKKNIWSNYFTS